MTSPTFEISVAFDSNGVRALERLDEPTWRKLHRRWDRLGLTTGWAPQVISEVMGTNLIRASGPPPDADMRDIARAVTRFDRLARGRILPQADDLVRKTFFDLAGCPQRMPATLPDAPFREYIGQFKGLRSARRLIVERVSPTKVRAGILQPDGQVFGIPVNLNFRPLAGASIQAWRKRITLKAKAEDKAVIKELATRTDEIVLSIGRQLGVPDDVIAATMPKLNSPEFWASPLAHRAMFEQWHYVSRAIGKRPGAPRENDGRDIALATYIALAERYVIEDTKFRTALADSLEEPRRVITFPEFLEMAGLPQAKTGRPTATPSTA